MAIEIMKRVEKKYIITTSTYLKLLNKIENHAELDPYNINQSFYTISNLYYDTADNNLIRTSIAKPKYKEKLRLRAYGIPTEEDMVYLELKKKFKGVVSKRRTAFGLSEAYAFAEIGSVAPAAYMNSQVVKELEYFIRLYKPAPKLYLAYDRRAYFGENGLRITFDTNIRTRRYDLKLEKGDYGKKLINEDLWLMEIKTPEAIPLWLTRILSRHEVYATSFSKYGAEYENYIQIKGEREQCLNQFSAPREKRQAFHGRVSLPQLV